MRSSCHPNRTGSEVGPQRALPACLHVARQQKRGPLHLRHATCHSLSKSSDDAQQTEIPAMGWMWQTSKGPTASSTVANLKMDRIKPKKSLGQNFLTDDSILQNIVKAAAVKPGDLVLEIGPGTGNLTKHLLKQGAQVTAVEKDDTLYERLVEEYAQEPNLRLVRGDVLRADVDAIIQEMVKQDRFSGSSGAAEGAASRPGTSGLTHRSAAAPAAAAASGAAAGRQVKVVANLPYNITKDFLTTMLPKGDLVSELSIMIQEEAAQRLVDKTVGRPDYRAMNLRVNFYSNPKYRFLIPKEKYFPAPGVDGALVTFQLLPPGRRLKVPSERGFLALVGKAFLSRRKMMRNSVEPLYTTQQVEAALRACDLRPDARAQDLSLADFVRVHWALSEDVVRALRQEGADMAQLARDEEGEEEA